MDAVVHKRNPAGTAAFVAVVVAAVAVAVRKKSPAGIAGIAVAEVPVPPRNNWNIRPVGVEVAVVRSGWERHTAEQWEVVVTGRQS